MQVVNKFAFLSAIILSWSLRPKGISGCDHNSFRPELICFTDRSGIKQAQKTAASAYAIRQISGVISFLLYGGRTYTFVFEYILWFRKRPERSSFRKQQSPYFQDNGFRLKDFFIFDWDPFFICRGGYCVKKTGYDTFKKCILFTDLTDL